MELLKTKNLGGIIPELTNLGTNLKTVLIDLILTYSVRMNIKIKWLYFSKEVFLPLQILKAISKRLSKETNQ
jgi:hypothetical protein